ncbi:MAG TPA: polyhydroxyalkanoic acid system family protein [Candidatus Competibacteraceae bacterium]|nr:polyhydroxyalkanoic acid system family protein [Candidatus Competibacteraceae bacterium]
MTPIRIRRTHHLSHEQARQAALEVATHLSTKFALEYHWEGDVLHFRHGSGVQGQIAVLPEEIRLQAYLGWFLLPLRGRIEAEIERYLAQYLKPPP